MIRVKPALAALAATLLLGGALAAAPSATAEAPARPVMALQVGHGAGVTSVAYSPDGRFVLTGSDDASARIWNAATGQVHAVLNDHQAGVTGVGFSPDGRLAVTICEDERLRFWDPVTGALKARLSGHSGGLTCFAFSPDGARLLTGSVDRTARLWDVRARKTVLVLRGHTNRLTSVAFAPRGGTLATASFDGTARLWTPAGKQFKTFLADKGYLWTAAFSPDGKVLATAGADGTGRLWSTTTFKLVRALKGHSDVIRDLAFSPDGKRIATAGWDKTARLWDAGTGKALATLSGHEGRVGSVRFSKDGSTLVTAGWDNTARLWDASSGNAMGVLQGHRSLVHAAVFSPDGQSIATVSSDGTGRLWDRQGTSQRELPRNAGALRTFALSPNGRLLALGGTDGVVRVWDADTGQLRSVIGGHANWVTALAFSPDGKRLASGSMDRSLKLWEAESGAAIDSVQYPFEIQSLQYSPDGALLAIGGEDGKLRLANPADGAVRSELAGHTNWIGGITFSSDGRHLITASYDATARVWDVSSGKLVTELRGHNAPVRHAAFAPDGKLVATASGDGTARVWDAATGAARVTFSGGGERLAEVAFSPDGKRLAARAVGGSILCWELAGRKPVTLSQAQLGELPITFRQPVSLAGASASLHEAPSGAVMATLMPVPPQRGANGEVMGSRSEWFVSIPQGYFDCSANAASSILWNVKGSLYPAERYLEAFRRPDLVQQALRRERVEAQAITVSDVPPDAWFVDLKVSEDPAHPGVLVVVEASDDREVKELDLRVNGRPVPADQAKPIEFASRPIDFAAKPIELSARPIELSARPIELSARPIELLAKPIELSARSYDPNHRELKRYTYRLQLPAGGEEVRIQALARDDAGLKSDPVEVVLRRLAAPQAVAGNLYVLAVGVSKYRNADGKGFRNLQFPAVDAQAIADRFKREGKPLYERVEVRTLLDQDATLERIRGEIKSLQSRVRPGGLDTVVLFLSGHGLSVDGRYYFATHDLEISDKAAIAKTGFAARELRELLGGSLPARSVFLFVDTCHAGALSGQNGDLTLEVGDGVFVMASTGGKSYSYESEHWGHGAFTLSLLKALNQQDLARSGVIHFNALAYAVPDGVAELMKEAGRSDAEQEPCVPLSARRLRVPLVSAPGE